MMAWRGAALLLLLLRCTTVLAGAAQPPQQQQRTQGAVVRAYVHARGVSEASGLQASRKQPGVLWTHNDDAGDGSSGQLFALDTLGEGHHLPPCARTLQRRCGAFRPGAYGLGVLQSMLVGACIVPA
jgi:hypothetical protein